MAIQWFPGHMHTTRLGLVKRLKIGIDVVIELLDARLPGASANLRSTSVIAQFVAAQQGRSLAILPCFLAAQDPRLLPVLPEDIDITRQFWMYCREDLRKLKRITLLWDYIREVTERNQGLLMGQTRDMQFAD